MTDVSVVQTLLALHGGGVTLACSQDGTVNSDDAQGLFAADTRVLSSYRFAIEGQSWEMLGRWDEGHGSAQWQFQNARLRTVTGEIGPGTLQLSLRRRVHGAMHDDLTVQSFARQRVRARFLLELDADFSDIFEVKAESIHPRLSIHRRSTRGGIEFRYEHGGFRRGLLVTLEADSTPSHTGALVTFELDLRNGEAWHCCVDLRPEIDGTVIAFHGDPHVPEGPSVDPERPPRLLTDELLARPFTTGRADLHALAVREDDLPYVAAGVPWFQTIFGRDQLITGLMSGIDGPWVTKDALAVLGPLQAKARDDWRDAEPGKLPHELRRGELAQLGRIPHTPYYGTHDAPALFCLALWDAWRWTGDRGLVEAHLGTAHAALAWCDDLGDRDGDGLQEYETRSEGGYFNQGWKDAGDAIVDANGAIPPTPLATLELQAYLYAARLALAELLDATGDPVEARRLREAAAVLRQLIEQRFWFAEEDCYALALDGGKRQVASVASNQGHLLWCGVPSHERAEQVAERLLRPDMFSGWGLRTLSATHPAYNPLSYQSGSVWPHDTMLAAAGLWRYGLREQAWRLLQGILEAANAFEDARLTELFCGFDREACMPVPYYQANRPQAWAAAAPLLAVQLLLGIVPDAPRGRCFVDPALPDWLPTLALHDLAVGPGRLSIAVSRRGADTHIDELRAEGVEVIVGTSIAPLWGSVLGDGETSP